jgi:PAS domain S-box-containing protein
MNRLDQLLSTAEAHRRVVSAVAVSMVVAVAWADSLLPEVSLGYLYLIPLLLSAAALRHWQIVGLALLCAYLREAFDPLQQLDGSTARLLYLLNPLHWVAGASGRFVVVSAGFAMTGFFVAALNERRRLLAAHLAEREENERQVRVLIETSPLAILTLDAVGRVQLANQSARDLLGFDDEPLQGIAIGAYLPLLKRLLQSQRGGNNMRTSVECKGQRRTGEVFLAHVWLSTYGTSSGPGLAAVVWDASENLRDREGAGLDSMMATSRVLIGAMSHEFRNLAAAAASAHAALGENGASGLSQSEQYLALGSLIRGLEKIAASGLRVASNREMAVADLDTVLDEARIVMEPSLREAGIELRWDVQAGLPLVQADHHSLLQVFVNLARNSQQALEANRPARRQVRLSTAVESDLVVVRVSDSGPGVAHPEALFQPFQPGAQSAGLGLYISRAILRAHGGGLRYEPQPEGSCFAVELWPAENTAEAV